MDRWAHAAQQTPGKGGRHRHNFSQMRREFAFFLEKRESELRAVAAAERSALETRLTAERSALETKLGARRAEVARLQVENTGFQAVFAKNQEVIEAKENQIQRGYDQKATLEQRIEKLEKEKAEMVELYNRRLASEKDRLSDQLVTKSREANDLSLQVDALQRKVTALEKQQAWTPLPAEVSEAAAQGRKEAKKRTLEAMAQAKEDKKAEKKVKKDKRDR